MAEKRHIQHVRSRVVESNGQPKLPLSSDLQYGEIAINYHKGTETVSLKNDQDEIITFHPDEVQIGNSGDTILDSTKVFIDTDADKAIQIYTQDQVDSLITNVINLIDDNIVIGTETPTSVNTDLFVDTSNDGGQYEVYTKQQVNAMIAELQRQINELKGN